jgi:hypothetical protein
MDGEMAVCCLPARPELPEARIAFLHSRQTQNICASHGSLSVAGFFIELFQKSGVHNIAQGSWIPDWRITNS